jgi:hypothetical protein
MTPSTTTTSTTTTTTITPTKPRIRVLSAHRYLVESTTRPGLGHQVDVLRLKCGCEAGKYGRRCRHLILALGYDEWRHRQRAAAEAGDPTSVGRRPVEMGMAALQAAF